MPSIVLKITVDKPINAPVFPAEIAISALPSETALIQPHIEDSFPTLLIASIGLVSISTTLSQ